MPVVQAGPNQYLVVGRRGALENRGSAVQALLWPGTSYVLVPSVKQEATFEFTQETKDGIPLRFKGIVIYRVVDPVAAARAFDFASDGLGEIGALLTHVSLGELRHAVSHMTMVECIEQRKTTLGEVVAGALQETIRADGDAGHAWGITVEVAQVAQVFIVDPQLRAQLEAGVRDEIRLGADQSAIRTQEVRRLAEIESQGRVDDQSLAADKGALRREQEKFHAQLEIDRDRVESETPMRLLAIEREREVLAQEIENRRLRNELTALEVEGQLMADRARQALRREILPIEQAPQIVEAASQVLRGTNLAIYGENAQLVGQLAPLFDLLGQAVRRATEPAERPA